MNITANQPASPMPMPYAHALCPICEYFAPCSIACPKPSKIARVFLSFSDEINVFFIFGARTIFQHFSTARVTSSPFARTSIFQRRFDRCRCLDRSRCSKMIENLHAFSYSCIRKSTHFYFRGPNNFSTFFNGAPHIRSLCANLDFSTPIRSMSMPRSIEVLKNDRKFNAFSYFSLMKSTHLYFRGPNNFSTARVTFSLFAPTSIFERRFDRCRCVDRSRSSKMIENFARVFVFVSAGCGLLAVSAAFGFLAVSNVDFSMPIRSMSMPRSIEVL